MNTINREIRRILGSHTRPLVEAFYDPSNRFAGATFDTLEPNHPRSFSASDLLATSLLDVRFLPRAVRQLLEEQHDTFDELLGAVPWDVSLWESTDAQLAPAYELWRAIRRLDGVGPTRTSKLMARKRPQLIPVVDSIVRAGLNIGKDDDSWTLLRDALQEDDAALVDTLEELRPRGLSNSISTLRILDAAIWMNLSRSEHVIPFRNAALGG